ncbi:MAG: hypothetical protein AB7K24_02105 [Gemmataceae bacterium]
MSVPGTTSAPDQEPEHGEGLHDHGALDIDVERRLDAIEMLGEEEASGLRRAASDVTAGMRYLHSSRTIHQLVTDRNRAVAIYLAVASLLWTASAALLTIRPDNVPQLIIPIRSLQRWCLPVTFAALTLLSLFVAFLLIRTRIGLIYEVAKMNVLLRLPAGRVKRVNPLSIFFIMQVLISVGGGVSAALFFLHMLYLGGLSTAAALTWSVLLGLLVSAGLVALYVVTVLHTTGDDKLRGLE